MWFLQSFDKLCHEDDCKYAYYAIKICFNKLNTFFSMTHVIYDRALFLKINQLGDIHI